MISFQGFRSKHNYLFSICGVLYLLEGVCSLIAFISASLTPWCHGYSYCYVPIYASIYLFYTTVTFGIFLTSSILLIVNNFELHAHLPLSRRTKRIMELTYLSIATVLYLFGNGFMTKLSSGRIPYMTASVFGCLAMSILFVHLAIYTPDSWTTIKKQYDPEETEFPKKQQSWDV